MTQVTVGKWGQSLGVRLPGQIVDAMRINEGERLDIEALDGAVVLRRSKLPPTLAELFRGKTASAWRADYAAGYDWGPDVGREIVPE